MCVYDKRFENKYGHETKTIEFVLQENKWDSIQVTFEIYFAHEIYVCRYKKIGKVLNFVTNTRRHSIENLISA